MSSMSSMSSMSGPSGPSGNPDQPSYPVQPSPFTSLTDAHDFLHRGRDAVGRLIVGHERELDLVVIALATLGHVLIVGPSGAAKTRTVRAFAHILGVSYGRIQGRNDLLPSGVLGYHRYSQEQGREVFVRGPILHGLVLADELNRSPEEAKSAFLEPMEEGHITVDGETYRLPPPGLLIATINPSDGGTYPLLHPERERFRLHVPFDFLGKEEATLWLEHFDAFDGMPDVPDGAQDSVAQQNAVNLLALRAAVVHGVAVTTPMNAYMVELVRDTRTHHEVLEGCGDRAIQHLYLAAKATALFNGHEAVWPDDVQQIAPYVLGHRMVCMGDTGDFSACRDVVNRSLAHVPVPHSPVAGHAGRR